MVNRLCIYIWIFDTKYIYAQSRSHSRNRYYICASSLAFLSCCGETPSRQGLSASNLAYVNTIHQEPLQHLLVNLYWVTFEVQHNHILSDTNNRLVDLKSKPSLSLQFIPACQVICLTGQQVRLDRQIGYCSMFADIHCTQSCCLADIALLQFSPSTFQNSFPITLASRNRPHHPTPPQPSLFLSVQATVTLLFFTNKWEDS